MNYKKLIIETLTPLGVPVAFLVYNGTKTTYMTFFCYNEQGEEWAEDMEVATGYSVQVDIWSKSDYTTIEAQVLTAMLQAGFKRTSAQDLYETDTKIFHKAMRFIYTD